MTWKRKPDGTYERACRSCSGRGIEALDRRWSKCPCDNKTVVEHPGNSCYDPKRKHCSVGWRVERCNDCGLFWCVWFETGDDSVDYPSPECLGKNLPYDDWKPGGGK